MSIILSTDSYKASHWVQYPKDTTQIHSYVEARGTQIPGVSEVVFFGLQAFINDHLLKPITLEDINLAEATLSLHGVPFNREGWEIILKEYGGYLPITIRAVPEGTPVPLSNVMCTVVNNDDRLPWLTSYIETLLLSYVWYGSTVATLSREIKKTIKKYMEKSCDTLDGLPFKLHDFGYRGVAAGAAGLGGAAHLVNFQGTDTLEALTFAHKHYNVGLAAGVSIPASEHSTMTSWGQENELAAYQNMVDQYAKKGKVFACVIDSYDTMEAIKMWHDHGLFDRVKEAGATVVIRPDSGDPVQMPIDVIMAISKLEGHKVNSKGYFMLPDHIRVIQGDGIDHNDVEAILSRLTSMGWSADNIAFGMGGGLLQKVNRDTFKFAMKASWRVDAEGTGHPVVKNPKTDQTKKSKSGILTLVKKGDQMVTQDKSIRLNPGEKDLLVPVYSRNKQDLLHIQQKFQEVREKAAL